MQVQIQAQWVTDTTKRLGTGMVGSSCSTRAPRRSALQQVQDAFIKLRAGFGVSSG